SPSGEDRHLRRCANIRIVGPDRREPHLIVVALGQSVRPAFEFGAGPLKPVVLVSEGPGRQGGKAHVVLAVRRRYHNRRRLSEVEEDALERGEARWIEMLDYLDDGRRVVAGEALVAIGERPVEERDARPLPL